MEGFRAKPGSERPSVYSDAGLDRADRRFRREYLGTLVFVWAISAGAGALLVAVTGSFAPVVLFALFAIGGSMWVVRYARRQRSRAEWRRGAIREVVARRDELDPDDAQATLDLLQARQRRVFLTVMPWGSLVIGMAAAIAAWTPTVSGIDALIGGAIFLAVWLWINVSALRKIDRDFRERREDTRALLAGR
jgi:hypothetical protein